MKHNGLGKLYDRFDPEERFRLTLEALARGRTRGKTLVETLSLSHLHDKRLGLLR